MHQKVDTRIRLALIYGSSREGRFCDKVAGWAVSQIEGDGPFDLAVVDPGEIDLPPRHVSGKHPALEELRQVIDWADGFVVVTPEYNRGYPAILKFLIDAVGPEWRGKPVGFVSYGGISGGLRAVEQLRLVFGELHAAPIRDGVAFADVWSRFDAEGGLLNADRAEQAMATMLAQLHWWASALRTARRSVPYGQFVPA
ncbi:NADPH-dependent FMN reductase [Bosea sp. RAF48]|uniref:NADPH-dependent FMN reductase n=1 Tax=Bosea sp. RAF48 TaxID=3237480 RepID=UPI003F92D901